MKSSVRILLAVTCLSSGFALRATAQSQTPDSQTPESQTPDPQTAPAETTDESATKPPPDSTTVTVTGKKKAPNDREVYDVTKNVDAQTGTAADALNKIPGVNVDPAGKVTYHGRNVVVYLNGRPSLMLSGDNRALALKSMPSAYITTIEVISNPGSQFSSGDGAPIININTQRNMPAGLFGAVSATFNSPKGNFEAGFLAITKGKWSLTLTPSYSNASDTYRSSAQITAFDTLTAPPQSSTSTSEGRNRYSGPFLSANLQYDAGPNDVLAAAVNYNRTPSETTNVSQSTTIGTNGQIINRFDQTDRGHFSIESQGLSLNYTHYGKKPDETLKIDASVARNAWQSESRSANTYLISTIPANVGTRIQTNSRDEDRRKTTLRTEYNTPVGDDQLTVGGEIDIDDNTRNSQVLGPGADDASLVINPLLTNAFRSHQVVSAFYTTFQRELTPRWTVLVGVRCEALSLTTNDLTYRTEGKVTYTRLNPSLYATYVISPTQKLRFNYTHRQQRPEPADLNPHIVYSSDTSVEAGNPDLKPQENDAIEARYEFNGKTLNYAVQSFWRRDTRTISTISQIIPDPQGLGNIVMQTMRVNWRQQNAFGLATTLSKQVSKALTLTADASLTHNELRNPQIDGVRSGTSTDGSLSIQYNFPKGDRFSATYKMIGKSFSSQGYTTGSGQANLDYSHKLTPNIDLDVSVNDLFRQTRTVTVIDTPLLQTRFVSSRQSPTFMISLSRQFSRFAPMPKKEN
ncbi:TonB-dependent receptor [Asticcacaulis sp. 201]|uniref:TonB-dependent receptor n=1 Tax=Asticcacaulis sp. 201 TaxID=3028787 RepID=UPI00291705CC|nr:TonB-dependent receptor [Asticcacaulis sp. 201]MDV6329941.1 TonB-dependent receptor [Asticcacaulis sp. 201]